MGSTERDMQQTQTFKSGIIKTVKALVGYSPFIFASIYMILKNIAQQTSNLLEWPSLFLICVSAVLLFGVGFFNFFFITVEARGNGLKLRRSGVTYAYLRYARYDVRLTQSRYSFFFIPRTRFQIECSHSDSSKNKRKKIFICHYFDEESFRSLSEEVEKTKKSWLDSRATG
jgi:hypothetical protein